MFRHLLIATLLNFICATVMAQSQYPTLSVDSSDVAHLIQNLRFDDALTLIKKNMSQAKKKRQSTARLERQQRQATIGQQMLKGTARLTIVDSVVVSKSQLLSAYHFSPEVGKIWLEHSTFGANSLAVFETERGNRQYKAQIEGDSLPTLQLVSVDKEGSQTALPRVLEGLGIDGDVNYPFMMADGTTFYFAAQTDGGLGHYDLYVTRYDSDSEHFYKAENLGFPYNSYANDYLLVIDEVNNIGWFASDRYQPAGKVCVYTFIPATSRHTIDYEHADKAVLRQQASLRPIKSTWTEDNAKERAAAKQRMNMMLATQSQKKQRDFELVINDQKTYTSLSDFKSPTAKQLCQQWLQKQKNLHTLCEQLSALRDQYAQANRTQQRALSQQILDLEKRVEDLTDEVAQAEKETRNAELSK
ncbi:MAG: hypothetical protein IKG96_08110 [Bacteroidaceae bacterium]|nr:hypothetical protein [Bacteroidaceae bacterium]